MYHEETDKQVKKKRQRSLVLLCLVVVVVIAAAIIVNAVSASAREQGAAALRASILDSAKQCCAIEGSYPSTLQHLEESYGLTVNHTDYVITYEYFADNIMPNVVVTPR